MLGKLVRINRASIGAPKGTLGLVTGVDKGAVWEGEEDLPAPIIYTVYLCQPKHRKRKYLARDLEEFTCEN